MVLFLVVSVVIVVKKVVFSSPKRAADPRIQHILGEIGDEDVEKLKMVALIALLFKRDAPETHEIYTAAMARLTMIEEEVRTDGEVLPPTMLEQIRSENEGQVGLI